MPTFTQAEYDLLLAKCEDLQHDVGVYEGMVEDLQDDVGTLEDQVAELEEERDQLKIERDGHKVVSIARMEEILKLKAEEDDEDEEDELPYCYEDATKDNWLTIVCGCDQPCEKPRFDDEEDDEEDEEDEEDDEDVNTWSVQCYNLQLSHFEDGEGVGEYGEVEYEKDFTDDDLGKEMAILKYDALVAGKVYGKVELLHYVDGDGDIDRAWEQFF